MTDPEEDRGSARDRILAVASSLFAERGFDAVSVADIARASGISTGLIYYHFTDKQTLYETSISESVDLLKEVAVRSLDNDLPSPERLRRFVVEYTSLLEQHTDLMRMLVRAVSDVRGPVPRRLLGHSVSVIDSIEEVIASGVAAGELVTPNPRLAALALFALLNTPVTAHTLEAPVHGGDALPLDEQAAFMVDLFLKGITPCC